MSCKTQKSDCADPDCILGGFHTQNVSEIVIQKAFAFFKNEMAKRQPEISDLSLERAATQVIEGTRIALVCAYQKKDSKGRLTGFVIEELNGNLVFERVEF